MLLELNAKVNQETFEEGCFMCIYPNCTRYNAILTDKEYNSNRAKNIFFISILAVPFSFFILLALVNSPLDVFRAYKKLLGIILALTFILSPFIRNAFYYKKRYNKVKRTRNIIDSSSRKNLQFDDIGLTIENNGELLLRLLWGDIAAITVAKYSIIFYSKDKNSSFFISRSHEKELERILNKYKKEYLLEKNIMEA